MKSLFLILFSIFSVTASADALPCQKEDFFYIRFGAATRDCCIVNTPIPGLGVGYRRLAGHGAADISLSCTGIIEDHCSHYFWTLPKASYYHYLQPHASKSFYLGGGVAWGGVVDTCSRWPEGIIRDHYFVGIVPSACLGFEFAHRCPFLGFTELTLSQPALAITRAGHFPGPILELSVGIGF